MTFIERFWSKVAISGDCWLWTGHLNQRGKYGHIRTGLGEAKVVAHRFSWEYINRTPVPVGLELDHLCRNRQCVNPAHLEAVTHKVNILRGESPGAKNARKTHCPRGHEYNHANTYTQGGTIRCCKICRRAGDAIRYKSSPQRKMSRLKSRPDTH